MRIAHYLRLSMLLASLLALSACSENVSWREQVPLAKGGALSVDRSVRIGMDEWARAGRGAIESQEIRFMHEGEPVTWSLKRIGFFDDIPVTLDVVDGYPVVVLPLRDWRACYRFGFPPPGFVAMSYRRGQWETLPPAHLPMTLKVNLLQSVRDVHSSRESVVAEPGKTRRDASGTIRQGVALGEVSRILANAEDSCASMNPALDRESREASERIEVAEKQALGLVAEALSNSAAPEEISAAEFASANGKWAGSAYLSDSCQGVVSALRPWYRWRGDEGGGAKSLVGARFVIHDQDGKPRKIEFPDSQAGLQSLVCDPNSVLAIKRSANAQLVIYRFARDGSLQGVFRVAVPGIDQLAPDGRWDMLWRPSLNSATGLSFSIADYRYSQSVTLGGTTTRRTDFSVRLPVAPE